jgi:antitoxin YefM
MVLRQPSGGNYITVRCGPTYSNSGGRKFAKLIGHLPGDVPGKWPIYFAIVYFASCTLSGTFSIINVHQNVHGGIKMDNIVTPTEGRKEFFKIIKEVNADKKPVIIKPTKDGEKGAVMIGEDDWNAIRETLFLINQGVDKQISDRKNDEDEDFDKVWNEL